MFFASDNWAGVHPGVAAALSDAAGGFDPAYGSGDRDRRARALFGKIFERDVSVHFVATGTAANVLSLTSVSRPGGIVFAHPEAHAITDECGAYQFQAGGRLQGVPGPLGKMQGEALRTAIEAIPPGFVHAGQPAAVTITQATEAGTVYTLDEIDAISAIARNHGLPVHMDGARFANALVSLGATPAEMTWKRGVDMLSFGGTKNGCWAAEAVVIFDPARAEQFGYFQMRAGQLFSKSRFVAAQFEAYFADDLWLKSARHANAMAGKLAKTLAASNTARLAWEPQANEIFAILPRGKMQEMQTAGAQFYDWQAPADFDGHVAEDEALCRFVTSFATTDDHVAALSDLLRA